MMRVAVSLVAVFALSSVAVFGVGPARAARITIACAAVGIEFELCREGAEAWAGASGHEVELVQTPNLANNRLALFQQLLAAESDEIDVFQIDVIWPGVLGRHFVDLSRYLDRPTVAAHFPALIENNTVDGELKALPWFSDAGLLYYRKDLLDKYGRAVPRSWADLAETARTILAEEHAADHTRMVGLVFQGKAYEGLTCNALEWIAGAGGGTFVAADGSITLNNPQAIAALDRAASWVGTIAPKGVLNYAEEEARAVFQAGDAVFMRNWPYAWALLNSEDSAVKGRVDVAPLPSSEGDRIGIATLGGAALAVSKYSRNPAIAADLVRHLASEGEQLRRAIKGAFNPTIPAVYDEPTLRAAQPFMARLFAVLTNGVARPARIAGARYNQLSDIVWNAVHDTLSGKGDAAANLAQAERRLERLSRGGRW